MARMNTIASNLHLVYDDVSRCNKCGFCQAACPIFDITKNERSAARGHNAHVLKLLQNELEIGSDLKAPLFECLLCMACVQSCFPGVRTHENVIHGRAAYLSAMGQPRLQKFLFQVLLPDQNKMARLVRLGARLQHAGFTRLARTLGALKWLGADFGHAEEIFTHLPARFLRDRITSTPREANPPRGRVGYFVGCGFNFALPRAGSATFGVLNRLGFGIEVAANGCCGLPAHSYGDLTAARKMALKNIRVLESMDVDLFVTECASCASFLKQYADLFGDDPGIQQRAHRLQTRVRGFSELIRDLPTQTTAPDGHRPLVTYHDPCHQCRYQGLSQPPREVLAGLAGLRFVEMDESDLCCGAAGSYNVTHYQQSMQVLQRKMKHLERCGADILVTECPSCCIQLDYGVRRHNLPVKVLHISQLLERCH